MTDDKEFTIIFSDNWYKKDDILKLNEVQELLVTQDPHRTWWRMFLQIITFGLYKAPWEYKVKIV